MSSSNFSDSKKNKSQWKNLIIWLLLAMLLRWQVIEPRWIPSGSMLPTLQIKERILVEKISPKINKLFKTHQQRESIVVFKPTKPLINSGFEANDALIKRIIGIPGDEIEVRDGRILRNGIELDESWLSAPIKYEMALFKVPPDCYWVLGDNRNNSLDSHVWGPLPEENIIGTAFLRYWPLQKIGPIRFSPSSNMQKQGLNTVRS